MEEFPVKVSGVLKSGHKIAEFSAFAFQQTREGWDFITYPEQRGYKTIITVKADSVALLSITAPEQMIEQSKRVEQATVASGPVYDEGDPQHGPRTHLSAANRTRTAEGANRSVSRPDPEAPPGMGRPMAIVPEYDEKGKQREIKIDAAMIKM